MQTYRDIEDIEAAGEEQKTNRRVNEPKEAEEEQYNECVTPRRKDIPKPKRMLLRKEPNNSENKKRAKIEDEKYKNRNIDNNINQDIGKIDLEILLLNTLIITDLKVQTITNRFINNKPYTGIFCFTETKVDCIDFTPVGLKIITKHRKKKEKKGGGLAIGYVDDKKKSWKK